MIEIRTCPVCGDVNLVPFITCVDHSVSHETFSIIKCHTCELLITSPRPSNNQLDKYYASPAYTSHIGTARNAVDKLYLTARNFTLKWKFSLLEKNTSPSSQKAILDFGCGTGEFLRVAKQNGWYTVGVEPSNQARQQAADVLLQDIKSSLQDAYNVAKQFNVVTLWHVLEHVDDLNTTLQKLKGLLAENGTMFIAVPNYSSWDGQHYKQHWAGYDVPRHLWHFSQKSMKLLLEKHTLTITKIIPMRLDAFYISLLSEKYRHHESFTVTGILNTFANGLRSNYLATRNMNFSSLIYVVRK